jgi:7,8-dihydropterin-6-yl-methyl-4-(beta-D-ribofuranosyl)aminobenzene 5'-phosphate synthase
MDYILLPCIYTCPDGKHGDGYVDKGDLLNWRHKKAKVYLIAIESGYMATQASLTVLVDNNTLIDHYFSGEPGLSFLIRTAGKNILFDMGYSGLFIRNAHNMGIELLDLDMIVFSHGHLDHTGGLPAFIRYLENAIIEDIPHKVPEILCHPFCFYPRPKSPLPNIGSLVPDEEMRRHFIVNSTTQPYKITEDLVFLGQIERKNSFEIQDPGKRKIIMPDGTIERDLIPDDSALALKTGRGLVIVTGCSHSGICNIVETARTICHEERFVDIIGGLHLLSPNQPALEKTRDYLQGLRLNALYSCHCTSLPSKLFLAAKCPVKETGVGMTITW